MPPKHSLITWVYCGLFQMLGKEENMRTSIRSPFISGQGLTYALERLEESQFELEFRRWVIQTWCTTALGPRRLRELKASALAFSTKSQNAPQQALGVSRRFSNTVVLFSSRLVSMESPVQVVKRTIAANLKRRVCDSLYKSYKFGGFFLNMRC